MGAPSGMITGMATPTRALGRRIAVVTGVILLLVIAPMVAAFAVAGPEAALATLMGVVAGVSGSVRSGWRRAANVLPLLGLLALASSLTGYGWGWVIVMAIVGLLGGIGMPSGYLPAIMYAGLVPTMVTRVVGPWLAVAIALFAVLGGVIGVMAARRLHVKPAMPGRSAWAGHEAVSGGLAAAVFVVGTSIAVAAGLPHGYWVALTLIVVIPPIAQGDDTRRGRERLVGTLLGVLIVIPVSLIPMPGWAFYLVGFVLLVPAFVVMRKSYTYYAFFESAAVVMLVSAGNNLLGVDAARVEASVIGVALVAVTVVAVAWVIRHLTPADVAKGAIAP